MSGNRYGASIWIELDGACYHVTSRGDKRKVTLQTAADRQLFLSYPSLAATRQGAGNTLPPHEGKQRLVLKNIVAHFRNCRFRDP